MGLTTVQPKTDKWSLIQTVLPYTASHSMSGKAVVYRASEEGVAIGSHIDVYFQPDPAEANILQFGVNSTSGVTFEIYEGVDASGGTPLEAFNYNREVSFDYNTSAAYSPSITSMGTLIGSISTADKKDAFDSSDALVLDRNQDYIFRAVSQDAGNTVEIELIVVIDDGAFIP